jgi:hypothetical protein
VAPGYIDIALTIKYRRTDEREATIMAARYNYRITIEAREDFEVQARDADEAVMYAIEDAIADAKRLDWRCVDISSDEDGLD